MYRPETVGLIPSRFVCYHILYTMHCSVDTQTECVQKHKQNMEKSLLEKHFDIKENDTDNIFFTMMSEY